jgi:arylsulfatase A-like enzyme
MLSNSGRVLCALALSLPAACSEVEANYSPNVVVIVIDTLRADDLPPYGGDAETAPFIAELASRSVVFQHAWSASSWTAPATASIFTSRHPNEHGVVNNLQLQSDIKRHGVKHELNRIPSALETLPEFMQSRGYKTYGVSDNINVDAPIGFASGFDQFQRMEGFAKSGARRVTDQALSWKDEILAGGPFFLYLHYMDPHEPYERHTEWIAEGEPTVEDREMDRAAYRSEIRNVDEKLREVFTKLNLDDNTIVIFTADHGQEFGEHGHTGHKFTLYSELTNVPLMLHVGDDGPTGRSMANVSNMDILPTLRDLLGAPVSGQDRGVSLLEVLDDQERGTRELHAMRTNTKGSVAHEMRSVVIEKYKLIINESTGHKRLYNLELDPGEQKNIAGKNKPLVKRLTDVIEAQKHQASLDQMSETGSHEINKAQAEILKTLGYTGE